MATNGFSDAEVDAVVAKYPGLRRTEPFILEGGFELNASYEGIAAQRSFLVRIVGSPEYPERIPTFSEIGGETDAIMARHRIRDPRNLHRNANGTACLCVKQMESKKFPPGSTLLVFTEELVVPYLYGLSEYDKNGRWPWPEYSHGALGLLEYYAETSSKSSPAELREIQSLIRLESNWKDYHKQIRRPSGDRGCPCGSRKPIKQCHPKAWRGIQNLSATIRALGLSLYR
jgi:hypothetical protein